jgi:transposase
VAGRFYCWRKTGLWQRLLETLQQEAEAQGKINWDIHFVDGSVIRAHQHAAGAKRGL